ncbi:hypothetical protein H5410_059901 [Solanum commersonii]|uniref:Uncharacterized protein n=1 Tax=Solanum commersonii TaxID=4109 RepID=A0A9J5W419_SOLCO|nr:hypothetical protein H5410_059901 [Solanum commersonii]
MKEWTCKVDMKSPTASTATNCPASFSVRKGVITCMCNQKGKPIAATPWVRTGQARCDELDPEGKPLAFTGKGFELETSTMEVPSPNHWATPKGDFTHFAEALSLTMTTIDCFDILIVLALLLGENRPTPPNAYMLLESREFPNSNYQPQQIGYLQQSSKLKAPHFHCNKMKYQHLNLQRVNLPCNTLLFTLGGREIVADRPSSQGKAYLYCNQRAKITEEENAV